VRRFRPRRRSPDERLDRELRDHVERRVADYVARGMSEADARRHARLELGGLEQAKEACRDVRPLRWLDEFARDVRLGFRSLRRDRMFAFSVTFILALGIGTSVTMFSVLDAVVLRPLPYARPGELARISTHLIAQNRWDGSAMANILDWREQSHAFASMTFYRRTAVSTVTFGRARSVAASAEARPIETRAEADTAVDAPQRAQEGLVGPEFFELLGTPPLLGRTFSHEEFERGERVVVLSEGLWTELFARSEAVPGQTLWIDGRDYVVIGVMPRTFQLPTRETRLWRPLSVLPLWPATKSVRDGDQFEVLGRLRPGVSFEAARAEMGVIAARLRDAHAVNRNIDIQIAPLSDHVVGSRTRRGVWLGFAAVLCLLLIACANAGGLLSARAARRRRELAVRAALGAGRARLVRQLLAEGVSLWAVASVAGVLLSYALIGLLLAYGPRALPRMEEAGLDVTALAVAFGGGLVVVIACGTLPALAAAKADAGAAFGTRDRTSLPRGRLQDWLIAGQIAGALMLLVGAALFAESFIRARGEDPGYPAENLLIVDLELPRNRYPDRPAIIAFFREASDRLRQLPGVVAVGGITDFFIRRNADQWVTIEGRAAGREEGGPRLAVEGVTPGYFRAVGIELLEGRDFEERDYDPGAPGVVIVSDALARRFWPGESALGRRLVGGESPPKDGRWSTVVGVVKDMRREGLDLAPILGAFMPAFPRGMDMTIRTSTGVEHLIPAARHEIRAIDASLPVPHVVSAVGHLSERLGGRRFETQALGLFAAIGLLLSAAGLYALLAYQVALRTREIGIRSALGADRRAIVRMILAKGVGLTAAGTTVGLVGAAAAGRAMQSLLYETPAHHLPSYAAVAAVVLLVGTIAAWLPALRASRVSPMTALRED
jgi:putative ABC transport system permease protein